MSDADRFTHIYGQYYEHVLAYSRRRLDEHTARDVTAETFLVAWRRLSEVPAQPLPWLYGVARNVVANERRRMGRAGRLSDRIAGQPPVYVDVTSQAGDARPLAEALATLSESDRELLQLIAWEGLSAAQAAEALGCLPATVSVRLFRARRRLKSALSPVSPSNALT